MVSQQGQRIQQGATLRVSNKWRRETAEAELAAFALAPRRQAVLRPKVAWAMTDRWKLIAGAELFRGAPLTLFERLRDNSAWFAELRLGF